MMNNSIPSGGEEPYHVFPNHPYQNLHIVALPLLFLCFLIAGIWHARNEKVLYRSMFSALSKFPKSKSRKLLPISLVFYFGALYILPAYFIIGGICILATGDDVPGLLKVAVIYEVAINVCLLSIQPPQEGETLPNSNSNSKILQFGRRLLFVALGILCGAASASNQFDEIDYYGPVRVTNLKLFADRPEQTIQQDNPSYYYYYTLQETLEWGGGWGCPASFEKSSWCKYSHLLDNKDYGSSSSDCKKRIECSGNPPSDGVGECVNPDQEQEAFDFLVKCTANALSSTSSSDPNDIWAGYLKTFEAMMNGMGLADSSMTDFERTRAPWLDTETAWRTAAVNCGECKVVASILPEDLVKLSHITWLVGCLMVFIATTLFCCGNGIRQKYVAGTQEESTLSLEMNTIA